MAHFISLLCSALGKIIPDFPIALSLIVPYVLGIKVLCSMTIVHWSTTREWIKYTYNSILEATVGQIKF